jgi:hypothetical protein
MRRLPDDLEGPIVTEAVLRSLACYVDTFGFREQQFIASLMRIMASLSAQGFLIDDFAITCAAEQAAVAAQLPRPN